VVWGEVEAVELGAGERRGGAAEAQPALDGRPLVREAVRERDAVQEGGGGESRWRLGGVGWLYKDARDSQRSTADRSYVKPSESVTLCRKAGGGVSLGPYKRFFYPRLFCTNQSSAYCPCPPALPTLLQYYRTVIAQ